MNVHSAESSAEITAVIFKFFSYYWTISKCLLALLRPLGLPEILKHSEKSFQPYFNVQPIKSFAIAVWAPAEQI